MKKFLPILVPFVGLACAWPNLVAADKEKMPLNVEKKQMRVLAAPEAGHRVLTRSGEPMEKETVTFLGVETAPASATLAAHLNLPKGAGLVVHSLVPDSPAANVLQPHDILLKFEDQLLIEQRQLSVLIRQRKEGDEVTLTLVRRGKETTVKVKLGTHEVPKIGAMFDFATPFTWAPMDRFEFATPAPGGPENEEEVDHLLELIQRGPGAPDAPHGRFPQATRIFIDREHGPGFRAMTVNPGNSNLVFSDDQGSLELTIKGGQKTLVAKDAKGAELFSGPVTTAEERAAMPPEIRARLEQLEGMQDVTFRTDGEFRGSEAKIVRPLGRSVSLPHPVRRFAPGRQPVIF